MMIEDFRPPGERDLPRGKLAELRAKIDEAILEERHGQRQLPPAKQNVDSRRWTRRLEFVAVALIFASIGAAAATTSASGINRVLHAFNGYHQSPADASREVEDDWRKTIVAYAHADPQTRFPNPSRSTLLERLQQAASTYRFTIETVEFLEPDQDAPRIVVRTDSPKQFADATPAIFSLLDPKQQTGDDRTGWTYEAFFLEADDAADEPFLIVFNYIRGPHAGGGQWARSDDLFPFRHGGDESIG